MMKKTGRALKWMLVNSAFAYALITSITDGNIGIQRVIVLFAWVSLVHYSYCCSKEGKKENLEKGPPIWLPIIATYNVLILVAFIYFGWWVTGIVWLFASSMEDLSYKPEKEIK